MKRPRRPLTPRLPCHNRAISCSIEMQCVGWPWKVWQRCQGGRGCGVTVMLVDRAIVAALVATVLGPCIGAGLFLLMAGM